MGILGAIAEDARAVRDNDPAAKGYLEVLLCYHTFHTVAVHRVNHALHKLGVPILPRFVSMLNRIWSGVEIHPGAEIGEGFFIDHGTGTVIGETTEIGKNVVLFNGVTLGGTGKHKGKRHPTVGNNVLIGTGSVILGPVKIGSNSKIGANTFIIMQDVPENTTVVGSPGRIVRQNGKRVSKELPKTKHKEGI